MPENGHNQLAFSIIVRRITLISIFALAVALAFTGPAFAGDVTKAKTEADCKAAGGMWDAATNTCAEKKSY